MNEAAGSEFIVLSAPSGAEHHVLFRPNDGAWLQLIATFRALDRATDYAEMHNQFLVDFPEDVCTRDDLKEPPPSEPEPADPLPALMDKVAAALQSDESSAAAAPVAETPIAAAGSSPPIPDRPERVGTRDAEIAALADRIMVALPALIGDFPKGPTVTVLSRHLDAETHAVQQAVKRLDHDGRAVRMSRKDSGAKHLVPLGYEPPAETLSETQSVVLGFMRSRAGAAALVSLSKREIARDAPCAMGSVQAVLDALVYKQRIAVVSGGSGSMASTYRLLDHDGAAEPPAAAVEPQAEPLPPTELPVPDVAPRPAPTITSMAAKQMAEADAAMRVRRVTGPRLVMTSDLMGDPGPGRSALDQLRAQQ